MKNSIRFQGLAAFAVIIAIFSVLWFFFVDGVVKNLIEKYGSRAVGAKVELDAADLTLFPAGLRLIHLQVTDPHAPMKNAVEISRISFGLEPLELLRRKVIIKEMTMDGIQLGTDRKTSGALKKKKRRAKAEEAMKQGKRSHTVAGPCGNVNIPSLTMPDVKEILTKENLHSLDLIQSLGKDVRNTKATWQDALSKLPDEKHFEKYRARIAKLTEAKKGGITDLVGSASELGVLQKDIQRDLNNLKNAQKSLGSETASLRTRLAEAKRAPLQDVARLKQKYSLSPAGLKNLSKGLLGSRLCRLVQKADDWYMKLQPMIERRRMKKGEKEVLKPIRGKGVNVRFKERNPLPDFLIRKANARVVLSIGEISGLLRNITPDQDILGHPLTYIFTGKNLKGMKSIDLHGAFDRMVPAEPKDTMNLVLEGYRVNDMVLSENETFPLLLHQALADIKLDALRTGDDLKATLSCGFGSARLSGNTSTSGTPFKKALLSSLSSISAFHVQADIRGTLQDYAIDLSSDLDRAFADAVGSAVKKQSAVFEEKLQAAVMNRVENPLQTTGKNLTGLNLINKELTDRLNVGNTLLGNLKGLTKKGGLKLPF